MGKPQARAVALVVAGVIAVGACSADGDGGGDRGEPLVVATTGIWADVVANVACDDLAEVRSLVPAGTDVHAFEPSLADRGLLDDADLVVANGLGLEEGLDDTLDQVEADGTPVFEIGAHVDTISLDRRDGAADGDSADPHVWFDPVRVSEALDPLAATLVDEAGLDAAAVRRCLADYRARLAETDRQIEEQVLAVDEADRVLVTNHDSLAYFADRYGFEVLGAVIPSTSTLAEASPAQIAALAEATETAGVRTVFGETALADDDLDALAEEIGAQVVTLYTGTLGDADSGADTYVGLLRTDAGLIVDGLRAGG